MIKISEATAIALHAMLYIAANKQKPAALKDIAAEFKISANHLSKVLQRLVKAGYLQSVKGPKGGFTLMPKKQNTTFLEIYETIEGKITPHYCLFASHEKTCKHCIMGNVVKELNEEFIDYLKNNTISNNIGGKK